METKSWNFPDTEPRTRMPETGPWADEPDKMQWQDPITGLPCLINRGPSGSLCGYVGVSKDHPFYGVEYSQWCTACKERPEVEGEYHYCEHTPGSVLGVHGGLTYTGFCNPLEGDAGICHVVGPDEDDKVWWFGFDTAHAGDLCPAHIRMWDEMKAKGYQVRGSDERGDTYKDVPYLMSEVTQLAKQLKKVKRKGAK